MRLVNTIANWYKTLTIINFDKDEINSIQQQRLRRLLRYAAGNSEFYQNLYDGIDIENCSLQDLPVVTKAAMMDNFDRFVTDKRLKLHEIQDWLKDEKSDGKFYLGEFSPFLSSGSTGESAVVVYHRKAVDNILANLMANYPFLSTRSIFAHFRTIFGYLLGKRIRIAAILIPRGNIAPLFQRVPKLHRIFVNLKIFSMLDPLDQIVDALNEFQPDQLTSHNYYLGLLAREQLAGRLKLELKHPMAYIAGTGELLTSQTQDLAARAWNVKIQNTYGAMECYLMATSCRMFDHLHLMSHLCTVEVVDRHYKPVPRGQYGEKILLTNLFNYTQPMIRYEIEDITGFASPKCQCGSPFPTLLPVQGRTTDFFYFKKPRGGYEQVSPILLLVALFYLYEIRQYQIVQTERNELTLKYVCVENTPDIELRLKQLLTEALTNSGLESHVMLKFNKVDSIPRHERSGKYKPMVSMGEPSDLLPK